MINYNSPKPDAFSYSALTNKQRQFWLGQQLYGSLPIYNLPLTFTIQGELKVQHFQKAFQALIDSCDAFRTLIEDIDGIPRVKVLSHFPYTMELCDFSEHPDPEHAAQSWIQPRMQHVFKLNECLFDSALIRLAKAKWIWFYNVHHIVSDGLTTSLMFHRMSELYGHSLVEAPEDQVIQPQYHSYVEWEADFFRTNRHQKGKDYWAAKLRQPSEPLQLYGRTIDSQLVPINRLTHPLDDKTTQAIYRLAGSDLATGPVQPAAIFEIFAALFIAYLHRISGQRQLSIGIPFHNRPAGPFKKTLGLFVEVAPLYIDIANTETFETLRKKIQGEVRATSRNVRSVPEHTLQHRPYDVRFNYHVGAYGDFCGMPTIMQWHHCGMSNVGLTFNVQDFNDSGRFTLEFDINAELFDETQQHRMLQHMLRLLKGFLKDPSQRLSTVSMLSDEEAHLVLRKFNRPPKSIAWNQTNGGLLQIGQCVHQLIEAQVARTPEAVALVCEDQQLTYTELNVRSNQLAYYLRKHGVAPEVPVGLCVDRSLEMVIGLLGILKAGGAYVPLDPSSPCERVAFILSDTQAPVLVTQQHLCERLPASSQRVVCLDAESERIGQESMDNLTVLADADSLAYVIYTSGSTGRPKGVEVEHRQVVNYVDGILEQLELPGGSSFAMVSPLAADLGNTMLYPALATGGTLHIISEERARDSVALGAYFRYQKPDCLKIVPSHLASLMMGPTPAEVLPQKRLVVGGEACPWYLVEKVQALKPGCRVINHYGPTETTVGVTTHEVEATDQTAGHSPSVPIGRPLLNSQVYILDSQENPVPLGVSGEVYIGGRGLARGYVNAPELTAEKFVPHPYSEEPGARLYKTGDRARFQPDGTIEFLGRIDHQVKLRGFRIELGEIETALKQHKNVQAAVVVVREEEGTEKQLVAYVVLRHEQLSPGDLRQFLKTSLPEYMVPTIFVMLEDLPLTPNGKVDRRALPAPAETRPELDVSYEAPHAGPEQTLADIWKQLLRVDKVGRHDNFFELGGDSILSIQLGARASQNGLRVTTKQIFEYQTIAGLAQVAGIYQEVIAQQGVVTGPLPLTPIQHWFFEQRFIEAHHWNMAWVLEAPEPLLPERMAQVVDALVVHHDALRLRLTQTEEGWQQKLVAPDRHSPFACFDWSHLSATEAEKAWELEAGRLQASLSLSDGPLIRVALAHFGSGQPDRILLVIHHLAVDGVSLRILFEDLQTAYEQLQSGKPIQLSPKTTSFSQWAERLLDHARSDALEQEVSYWHEVANTPCAPLPRDVAHGDNTVESAQTVVVALTHEETQTLLQTVPEVYHTQINDVLLTALVDALRQWTSQENLLINLEGHGREELLEGVDLSRTVGWFTSKFPVVLKRGHSEHPGESLKAVKEQLRQIPNRGIGYGMLRYLKGETHLQAAFEERVSPEVAFNYLGQFDQTLQDSPLFTWSTASPGPTRSPRAHRSNLVEIIGMINAGMLQMQWHYSENIHRRATMESLANDYLAALRALILHCLSPEAGGYTPSDFPLASIGQHDLDEILTRLPAKGDQPELADLYPLTPLQQGMWFHDLADRESGTYFRRIVSRLDGEIGIGLLKRAWQEVLDRHGILRASLVWEGLDQPLQVVHPTVVLPWEQQDWRNTPATEEPERLRDFLEEDRARGFDFTQAPLMRLTLIQVAERKAHLVWSYHHLILDRWSIDVVQKEVWEAYAALREGQAVPGEAPPPFREHLGWLLKQDLAEAERYWRRTLKGFTAPTLLGVERESGAEEHQHGHHGAQHLTLSEPATVALERFARQHQVTLNTLVQGAWAVVLSRYSDTEDVVFGITSSGRLAELQGIESMVGMFINTLPVRVKVGDSQLVGEWLREMQTQQVGMRQYEYTPLYEIQKWSEVSPGTPLFNTLLVFENTPGGKGSTTGPDGLSVQQDFSVSDLKTNYPLNLIWVADRPLHMLVTYDTERFEAAAISRLLGHVEQVLAEMVAEPEQHLGNVSVITEAERRQLLVEWNTTANAYPREATLAERFEAQVAVTPDAVAVVFGEDTLTYDALNIRANRLAHYLRQQYDVGPEVCVGLCMERNLEMVVGLLGILKAGGAYVPLDPNYPQERLDFMAKDAGLRVILTQEKFQEHLSQLGAEHIHLDADWPVIRQQEESTPVSEAKADSLAYVIYTSGSTGQPKGVQVTHANVVRLFLATEAWYQFNEKDVWTLFHSYAFDFSVWELWGALFYGGRVVIVPYDLSRSPEEFYKLLVKEQVTVLNQTPSAFRQLIQAETNLGPSPHLALRHVIFGGEALEVRSFKPWFDRHGDQMPRLVNMYGITETTVHVTYQPLSSEDLTSASVIGRPLPDLQVYILDRNLEPVPVGVPGELYVGGGGVARGYLNRPDLTAERFVAHPFSKASQARLYKTGDRGRFLANGAIEYLGRMDNQVQLRGFRIEPGEIETVLAQHPAVAGAVAVMREDGPEDDRLVAYVVPHEPSAPSPEELREFLLQKIPSYMVPGSFVVLKQLPLTANGKVDKRALPAPESADRARAMVHVAPSSEIQQRIARVWQDVLNLDEVGIQDNFFDLGGHSLLLMRVHNKLQSKLGQPVSVLDLIQFPTIEALAGYLDPEKSKSTVLADEDEEQMTRISEGKRRLMRLGRRRQSGKKA